MSTTIMLVTSLILASSPHCNPMFCNCPVSEVVRPSVTEVSNLLKRMRSNQGMPLSYLTPMSYWKDYNQIGGLASTRIQKAFGLDLKAAGALMLAYGLESRWVDGENIVKIISMTRGNFTQLHGNGEQWLYGENYEKQNDCGARCGLLMQSISDRPRWPDPLKVGKKLCNFWDCEQIPYSSDPPSLRTTVWGGMIGPLQLTWLRYVVAGKTTIPPDADVISIIEDLSDSMLVSTASIGGFYESPVLAYDDPLTINIASNLAFQSAVTMARVVSKQASNPGLTTKLDSILLSCKELFEGTDGNSSFYAWDATIGVFRESITIDPSNVKDPIYSSGWGLEAQLIGLNSYGYQLSKLFDQNPKTPINLWYRAKNRYGHYDSDKNLIGFGEDPTGPVVTWLTMLAVSAGLKLSRDYLVVDRSISEDIAGDVFSLQNNILGLQSYGCKVRPNTTTAENSTVIANPAPMFGYLATVKMAQTNPEPDVGKSNLKVDNKPPFVAMEEAAWAIILDAVYDEAMQFNPFVLTVPTTIPTPVPTSPSSSDNWFADNWGYIVGAVIATFAVVLSVGKAVRLRQVRSRYRDLREAEESTKGQNLGFF